MNNIRIENATETNLIPNGLIGASADGFMILYRDMVY